MTTTEHEKRIAHAEKKKKRCNTHHEADCKNKARDTDKALQESAGAYRGVGALSSPQSLRLGTSSRHFKTIPMT